ncbi:hypothetical protein NDU88_001312 [Pleurodeles waltl]|uniref:Uncharacterized protein n=1 Tax=Pleurodeles waltl TaxID=8319 RepID=A0AAV7Q398_PLEWA|nr:hypothetical protein NDU88_001312 [Pleurodeles waltl]
MKEYLRSNVIPVGLQVRNEPAIFIEDPKYRTNFSFVANQCSRHWVVLGIDTALEHINKLEKEIANLVREILDDTALTNVRQALEDLEKTAKEFAYITQKKKLDKLAKDMAKYDKAYTYPYLDEDYYKQDHTGKFVNRGRGGYRSLHATGEALNVFCRYGMERPHYTAPRPCGPEGEPLLRGPTAASPTPGDGAL